MFSPRYITIALGALALTTSLSAQAATPTVTLGGEIEFQAGFIDQESAFETGSFSREAKFANDTEVHVGVVAENDSGLKYGAVIELEADVTGDARGEGLNADKTYIFLESNLGRLEFGNQEDAATAMTVNASTIARASGGVEGDAELYFNSAGALGGGFLFLPNLPTKFAGGATEDTTKIVYYTPKFSGFQFGIDYAPDSGNSGTAAGFTTDADAGDFENLVQAGLSFEHDFDNGIGLLTSIVAEFGESEVATTEDLAAYQAGIKLSYAGFSGVISYSDWDDSGQAAGSGADADFWTAGLAYESGPYGVSATYLDSDNAGNEFSNFVVGADYQLAPGLVPYAEVSFFEFDEAGTTVDNEGTLVLIGSTLTF